MWFRRLARDWRTRDNTSSIAWGERIVSAPNQPLVTSGNVVSLQGTAAAASGSKANITSDEAFNFKIAAIYKNTDQEVIVTTADKIKLCLREVYEKFESANSWIAPLSTLVTIVIVFPTTTFRDWIIPSMAWQTIYGIAALVCAGWLTRCLWRKRRSLTIGEVLEMLKKS